MDGLCSRRRFTYLLVALSFIAAGCASDGEEQSADQTYEQSERVPLSDPALIEVYRTAHETCTGLSVVPEYVNAKVRELGYTGNPRDLELSAALWRGCFDGVRGTYQP